MPKPGNGLSKVKKVAGIPPDGGFPLKCFPKKYQTIPVTPYETVKNFEFSLRCQQNSKSSFYMSWGVSERMLDTEGRMAK